MAIQHQQWHYNANTMCLFRKLISALKLNTLLALSTAVESYLVGSVSGSGWQCYCNMRDMFSKDCKRSKS